MSNRTAGMAHTLGADEMVNGAIPEPSNAPKGGEAPSPGCQPRGSVVAACASRRVTGSWWMMMSECG